MQIKVKLYASLRRQKFDEADWECADDDRIASIVEQLGLARQDVGTVLVNGLHAGWDETVQEGDVVSLLPRMGGG
ncbi:MoaD/ThiS family protein [Geomonas sp. Red69]|uniref:MoaD/ThiS family protein n=1 Tax=Geomonas diazotrophica TaxID=2843197 RepID=UPI001C120825|nr:MoaD/ThiS family protein [Geomonas diazotrophica]MBU5635204.1 MoaD/ThiS family protein [Geomonas diazotrophica]